MWFLCNYLVIYWKHRGVLPQPQVGLLHYLKLKTQTLFDRAHPVLNLHEPPQTSSADGQHGPAGLG